MQSQRSQLLFKRRVPGMARAVIAAVVQESAHGSAPADRAGRMCSSKSSAGAMSWPQIAQIGARSSLSKRRRPENILALNDDVAPPLRSRDRVVKQPALVLDIAPHLIRPDDDDALELAIFGLLNRHCVEQMRPAATMLPAQRYVSRDHRFDFFAGKGQAPNCVYLIVDPIDRRSCWPGRRKGAQRCERLCGGGGGGKLEGSDDALCLIAVGSFPVDGVRPILLLTTGSLPHSGYYRLRIPAL